MTAPAQALVVAGSAAPTLVEKTSNTAPTVALDVPVPAVATPAPASTQSLGAAHSEAVVNGGNTPQGKVDAKLLKAQKRRARHEARKAKRAARKALLHAQKK